MTKNQNNGPRTERQFHLERYKNQFRENTKYGQDLLSFLEKSDCGVWKFEKDEADRRRWWLNVTLPKNVAEMFDAHLEIQLLYAEYEKVEPRLLELIQRRISNNARLDQGIFMIASLDDDIEKMLRRRRGEFAAVALNLSGLKDADDEIRHRMSEVLTAVDHYDMTIPVHNPSGFFGRKEEFQQIISSIESGQSVGIFGLRKTGKTSLLNYVAGKRRAAGKPVVVLDISGVNGATDFRVRLLEETWKCTGELVKTRLPRLRTLNIHGEIKVTPELIDLHWLRDIETLAEAIGQRLEVFIDEIDQMHPDRSHLGDDADALLIAMTQLRGMVQKAESGEGMVLTCAGVDPALFERPLLRSGSDNLLYKLVRLLYLAPLSREEMAEMVRDLGRRMGVRVRDHNVIDFLFEEYGGHALLTRKACSLASKQRNKDQIPWHMTLESVQDVAKLTAEGAPLRQAGEILTSFGEWFPEEAQTLRELWSADNETRYLAEMIVADGPELLAHAGPYGLLFEETGLPRIRAVKKAVSEYD